MAPYVQFQTLCGNQYFLTYLTLEFPFVGVKVKNMTLQRNPEVELLSADIADVLPRHIGIGLLAGITMSAKVGQQLLPGGVPVAAKITYVVFHVRVNILQMRIEQYLGIVRLRTVGTVVQNDALMLPLVSTQSYG